MVLVLDGVRLSENELGGAALSTIPIDTVDRIEIIRGGASVLYGEGATGGVIIITTKDQDTDKVWGTRQGAKDYLTKPVDEETLIATLNKVLAG